LTHLILQEIPVTVSIALQTATEAAVVISTDFAASKRGFRIKSHIDPACGRRIEAAPHPASALRLLFGDDDGTGRGAPSSAILLASRFVDSQI
jgi:hypothetical protein